MNIRCDVVFANQADRQSYDELMFDGHLARMVTTNQRGVGRNRNLALLYSKADYVLFADDDMRYADDCAEKVVKAFEELPEADVIVFDVEIIRDGKRQIYEHGTGPLPFRRSGKYGTFAFAARRDRLERANIWFHLQFGGGCPYSCGEDSLFLRDCYHKGLKVYSHSFVIGCNREGETTWFSGYNEKFFVDKGCWLSLAMPRLCRLATVALAWKWRHLNPALGPWKMMRLMNRGITEFRKKRL